MRRQLAVVLVDEMYDEKSMNLGALDGCVETKP
jgi:hypothetical protein